MHVVHVFHGPSWSFPNTEYSWFSYQSTFLFETVLGNSSVNARIGHGADTLLPSTSFSPRTIPCTNLWKSY